MSQCLTEGKRFLHQDLSDALDDNNDGNDEMESTGKSGFA